MKILIGVILALLLAIYGLWKMDGFWRRKVKRLESEKSQMATYVKQLEKNRTQAAREVAQVNSLENEQLVDDANSLFDGEKK